MRLLIPTIFASLLLPSSAPAYDPIDEVPADFRMPEPRSLEQGLASFQTHPGLRVELVAAEPMVADPINLDWGPDGKLWVVEMADYPLGLNGAGKPGGRVRFLEDTDGDGAYDRSTIFLEDLNFPTAVKAWRQGALVIAAPEIFYAEDTDGDGKADHREVLYRGFGEGNQQHRVNGFAFGLDNWLHLANGDSGGTIESVKTGKTVELGNFDLRIEPGSGALALETGRTQFGRTRDDEGNWFGCSNSKPLYHFALPDPALRRNPHVPYPSSIRLLATGAFAPPVHPAPATGDAIRFNDPFAARRITSACGLTIQRDPRLGPPYFGNAFVCEPVHNLVHRQVLEPDGASFTSRRATDEADSEFLTSTDTWFRPVTARTGPGGALWIVDMHRFVIEHPQWIPDSWQKVLDLRAGHDRGRLYRVVSDTTGPAVPRKLSHLSTTELVARLSGDNGWTRDTAQELLVQRDDATAVPALTQLLDEDEALGRLHALCTLDGLESLTPEHLLSTLNDPSPAVRRHAVRLASRFAPHPALEEKLIPLAADPDPKVRFQLALGLGEWPGAAPARALAGIALADGADPFFAAAVASSLTPHLAAVSDIVSHAEPARRAPLLLVLMETAIGTGDLAALGPLLDANAEDRFAAYATLLSVLDRRKIRLEDFRKSAPPELAGPLDATNELTTAARQLVDDRQAPAEKRIAAVALLGRIASNRKADLPRLLTLLEPHSPPELQRAALARLADTRQVPLAFELWPDTTPALRASIVSACLDQRALTEALLGALEHGMIPPASIDAANRDRLQRYPNSDIRHRARALFASVSNPDRAAVVQRFTPALERPGDPVAGRALFETACAVCHELDGLGRHLGPDLAGLADRSPGALLVAILDPNRAVEDKYLLYSVSLADGSALAGMIRDESGASLTLQLLDGTVRTLLRNEIKSLASTGISAMPEGLEAALDPQQLADLIAFVSPAGSSAAEIRLTCEGPFLLDTSTPGETKADGVQPSHPYCWQLSVDRFLWVFQTRAFTGIDAEHSILYQVRAAFPDGPVLTEGLLARFRDDWDPLGDGSRHWKIHGHPKVFGVPKGALDCAGKAIPHDNLFVAAWYTRARAVSADGKALDPHADEALEKTQHLEWTHFRLNDREDDIEVLDEPGPLRQSGYETGAELGPGIATMNHWTHPALPLDAGHTRWIDTPHCNRNGIAAIEFTYDRKTERYRWTRTGPMIKSEPGKGRFMEASINRFASDDWILCVRNRGHVLEGFRGSCTAWFRTDDPFAGFDQGPTYAPVPSSYCPRTAYLMADGVLRIFSGDILVSPQKNKRDPLFCWDVDPADYSVSNKRIVLNAKESLAIAMPMVGFAKLTPVVANRQLVTFRVTTQNHTHATERFPVPATPDDVAQCGAYYAEIVYEKDVPDTWRFAENAPQEAAARRLAPHFSPPPSFAHDFGDYESPLGSAATTADEWAGRREQIHEEWTALLGAWPPLIENAQLEIVESTPRDNFVQHRVRFAWTPTETTEAYLLVPNPGAKRKNEAQLPKLPAVVTVYYEPETAIGLGKPHRDFAMQLARRGFVTLSIGTTVNSSAKTYGLYHPSLDAAEVQPLSMLACAAANAWHALAKRPEVDPGRIGIVGHSFGGKWAMFASCLFDKFACAAWSDPGIVFDESRPSVNYWEPWYLGYHPRPWRKRGVITADNRARGLYPELRAAGRDLHELHALMAPRPFLVSGGSEDPPARWQALNHAVAVNKLLGYEDRVAMHNRPEHAPNPVSNEVIYDFFEHFLK